ncbi:MAG: hypothetical protein HY791_31990 [Deltaproteobacteria bacterium]|nr:hypothetical protein [Deltaproteobacteria bacterium]
MESLDRLGWTAGIAFEAFGLRLGVRVTDVGVLSRVEACLPHGARVVDEAEVDHLWSWIVGDAALGRKVKKFHLLYSGNGQVERTLDLNAVVETLAQQTQMLMAEHARGFVFVHAGAVELDGKVMMFPGRSFSGKSTLAAALVKAGARYFSDEYAVIDPNGLVHPYARPLALRTGRELHGTPTPVEMLGGAAATEARPVGWVVSTTYEPGAKFSPTRVSPGRGALEMLANTVAARSHTERALEVLEKVAVSAVCLTGPRGDAGDAAQVLKQVASENGTR